MDMGLFRREKTPEVKPYSFETAEAKKEEQRRIAISQQRLGQQKRGDELSRLQYEKDLQDEEDLFAVREKIDNIQGWR